MKINGIKNSLFHNKCTGIVRNYNITKSMVREKQALGVVGIGLATYSAFHNNLFGLIMNLGLGAYFHTQAIQYEKIVEDMQPKYDKIKKRYNQIHKINNNDNEDGNNNTFSLPTFA